MSDNEKTIEGFAKSFHTYHAALAPDFGCGEIHDLDWRDLPNNEQKRLIAAVRLALVDAQSESNPSHGNEPNIFAGYGSEGTEGRDCGC